MNDAYDMHMHLEFARDARRFVREAHEASCGLFACTVTPHSYVQLKRELASSSNGTEANDEHIAEPSTPQTASSIHPCLRLGVGMHPWWLSDGRLDKTDFDTFARAARETRYIGEVGLDFGSRHYHAKEVQIAAFDQVVDVLREGGKLVSIHAVRAADVALDMLESAGAFRGNDIVFHWFSGSSPELIRLLEAGGYVSVNEMMLSTRRGRAYCHDLPASRLLIESDLPDTDFAQSEVPGSGFSVVARSLENAACLVNAIRGAGAAHHAAETSARLLEDEGESA